jgi:hypothetical protein
LNQSNATSGMCVSFGWIDHRKQKSKSKKQTGQKGMWSSRFPPEQMIVGSKVLRAVSRRPLSIAALLFRTQMAFILCVGIFDEAT